MKPNRAPMGGLSQADLKLLSPGIFEGLARLDAQDAMTPAQRHAGDLAAARQSEQDWLATLDRMAAHDFAITHAAVGDCWREVFAARQRLADLEAGGHPVVVPAPELEIEPE